MPNKQSFVKIIHTLSHINKGFTTTIRHVGATLRNLKWKSSSSLDLNLSVSNDNSSKMFRFC